MSAYEESYKGYKISIDQDEYAEDPRKWQDYLGYMVCWHNRYDLGDKHDWQTPDDFNKDITGADAVILPLYLYDHSGITMSTSPFSCQWDSGQIGYIFITLEKLTENYGDMPMEKLIEKAHNILQSEVEEYDKYLTGDIWCYSIEVEMSCSQVDACCGFCGYNYCIESAKEYIDNALEDISAITDEEFDNAMINILGDKTVKGIIDIPGIYEVLAEYYNNEIIDEVRGYKNYLEKINP